MTNQKNVKTTLASPKVGIESWAQNVFFNTCFDKNHLKTLIAWFLEQYGEKVTVDLVETLKQVGFHQATRAGVSLGVDDLKIPPQKNALLSQASLKMNQVNNAIQTGNLTSVEKSQRLIDTWNQTSETLRQTAVNNFRTTNPVNPVYMMAFSGARGNISQVRQLVAMRGLMADPQGAILEFPIQSNFREGLTVTEYLISCYGARKGLVDTALRTATSGYLTRRLVDAVQHVVVHVTDCQTKKGIVIKEKNLEQRLIGRVLFEDIRLKTITLKKNTLISPGLAKQIALQHKEIIVRSPLTCKTEKSVCQLCYGLDLSQGKLVSIGEAVGIIAAQSIGEPGTQLTMRTFHTGGVGVFSDQAMKSFTAPFEGKVEFLEPLSGLFVRTPHGNIVYLLKHKTSEKTKPLLRLTSFQPVHKPNVYQIMHSDVPSGSLLWVKQGEIVKSGQLLLQASRLQTTTQEMPESSHPVRSPLSGEVFFQSMSIRVVEEEKRLIPKSKKKKHQTITNSQIQQKEISPKFPTLIELGNFWIFSTFIQKEEKICNSFFVKGDLVSSETPIQQYNLHLVNIGQLKKINSFIVFGQNSFQFLFSKIHYSGFFYFLYDIPFQETSFLGPFHSNFKKQKRKSNLCVYTSNSKSTLLTWYPFFKNRNCDGLGYCLVLPFQSESLALKNLEFYENSKGVINQKQNHTKPQDLSYIWSSHPVFRVKKSSNAFVDIDCLFQHKNLKDSSGFVVSQTSKSFSKTGIFQIESTKKSNWTLKTRFEPQFRKNVSKKWTKNVIKTKLETQLSSKNLVDPKFGDQNWERKKKVNFEPILFEIPMKAESPFVKEGLRISTQNLLSHSDAKLIQKKQFWAYIPEVSVPEKISSQLSGIALESGKKFENICFEHWYISINIIHEKNLIFLKETKKEAFSFYSLLDLTDRKKDFQTSFQYDQQCFNKNFLHQIPKVPIESKFSNKFWNFTRQNHKTFCFYKQNGSFQSKNFLYEIKKYRRLSHVLIFQKNFQQVVSPGKFYKQNLFLQKKDLSTIFIKSPFFTKQYKTSGTQNLFGIKDNQLKPRVKIISPNSSGWFSLASFLKVEINFKTSNSFSKREQFKKTLVLSNTSLFPAQLNPDFTQVDFKQNKTHKSIFNKSALINSRKCVNPAFSLFFYQEIKLQNTDQFKFVTFSNSWVLPECKITQAFLTSKKLGEFRGAQEKQKQTSLSIFQTHHRTTLKLPDSQTLTQNAKLQVGKQVRWGQQLWLGFAIPVSGQILKTTKKTLTLRKGIPLLASIRGLVHISHNDLIEKNDLLITLRSRRLQTEDIVQGIPKIEQLFEARETQGGEIIQNNMHTLLNNFFIRARQIRPFNEAVELSLTYIQKFLVENILEAYSNQGVTIAEKHVEIVVRQMTARVRITNGGDTGFLPGEFVQLRWIEKVNLTLTKLGRRQAQYEPVILGITKSVLQSESFLVAASFQQVSKVLVRSALAKKTDFLRGLHENILVGQPIPAGTGIIELTNSMEKIQNSLDIAS